MRRGTRQKVVAGAAVAVLLAGGAVAAVSATGQSNAGTRHAAARARARDLATAAAYLGTSPAALSNELSAGKTLAQIADVTAGKSKAGLIEALVAAERRAPGHARAVRARLSSKQLARRERRLKRRAQRLVQRSFAGAGAS